MSDARRLIALIVAVMGLGVAVFGVVRGLSSTGPARGIRLTVSIQPPVDAVALALALHTVTDRVEAKAAAARVSPAGDKLVVELGDTDPEHAAHVGDAIARTAKLEIRDATSGAVALTPQQIAGAEVSRGGVAIAVRDGHALTPGMSLAFTLDGKAHATYPVAAVTATNVHVDTGGTSDAALAAASDLEAILHAGASRPLRVEKSEPFTRATGFLPRAWLFLAIGGALLIAAALLGVLGRGIPRREAM